MAERGGRQQERSQDGGATSGSEASRSHIALTDLLFRAPQGGSRSRAWRTGDDEIEASGAMKGSGNFKAKQI